MDPFRMDPFGIFQILSLVKFLTDTFRAEGIGEEARETFTGEHDENRALFEEMLGRTPSFGFRGQTFGGQGPSVGPLEGAFDVGGTMLDFFRSNAPSAGDLSTNVVGPVMENVRGIFSDLGDIGDFTPRTTADLLRGVDLPSTDLSGVLGARLSGIGETGATRETQRLQDAARESQRAGLGLEGGRRLSESVAFQESGRRSSEAATAVGQTRAEEAGREIERARIQSGAASMAEQINSAMEGLGERLRVGAAGDESRALIGGLPALLGEQQANVGNILNLFQRELGLVGQTETDQLTATLTALDNAFRQAGFEQGIGQDLAAMTASFGQISQPWMNPMITELSGMGPNLFPGAYMPPEEGTSFGLNLAPSLPFNFGGGGG
jgi:hypothetical protein